MVTVRGFFLSLIRRWYANDDTRSILMLKEDLSGLPSAQTVEKLWAAACLTVKQPGMVCSESWEKRFLIRPRRTTRPRANDSGGRTLEAVPVQRHVDKSSLPPRSPVAGHFADQPWRD